MRLITISTFFFTLALCSFGCTPNNVSEEHDVCDLAAMHQEACMGVYVTPPICDDSARRQAEYMLSLDCEGLEGSLSDPGKADGAFCDWFGVWCDPDEEIFTGPSCITDNDCAGNAFCVEERCFEGVTSQEFSNVMDLFTDSQEVWGNYTYLLSDNDEARQLRREMVRNAEHSIHFTALGIEDNESGQEMVEDFVQAASRGIEVRVVVDATFQYIGSRYSMLRELTEGGVKLIAFNPANEWGSLRLRPENWGLTLNMRLHEKLLIIDGEEAIIGGRNVGDSYLFAERWRDLDVYVAGPGIDCIQRMFLFIWNRAVSWERVAACRSATIYGHYCPPEEKGPVGGPAYFPEHESSSTAGTRVIHSDPFSQESAHGYFTTLALVRGARHSIKISNAYFVPPQRLRKHLRAAVARGVEVSVVTNSKNSTDAWYMYYASLNFYKELIGNGIKVYEYNGTETLHSKAMLIDDQLAVVGSYNLDPRSAIDNSESMVLIRESQSVEQLKQALQEDIDNSTLASDDIPMAEMLRAKAHRIVEPLL